MQETLHVRKELMEHIVADFECLIEDMEVIADQETMEKVAQRLKDIKKGKVKGYSEEDFLNLAKEEGINV